MSKEYPLQTFVLDGYAGLDKEMLEQHYALYKGYVTNANKTISMLAQMIADEKADNYEVSEVRRRFGFEYNGMRLHEFYFGSMNPGGTTVNQMIKNAVSSAWGNWDIWMQDFIRTGMMRGIGWAILYQDPTNGALQNFWISDHENGHPAGFNPILVMDVWEHAYIKQYGAGGRKSYIESFFKNIDWDVVSKRLK